MGESRAYIIIEELQNTFEVKMMQLGRALKALEEQDPWTSVDDPPDEVVEVLGAWFDDMGIVEYEKCWINSGGYWLKGTGYVDAPDFWKPIMPPDAL